MVKQRALARQEGAGDLEGLGMPELTLKLSLLLNFWFEVLCAWLQQEAHLSAHTEVGDNKNGQLAEEGVPTEFSFIIWLLEELLHRKGLDLHYIANIQIVDPLILI